MVVMVHQVDAHILKGHSTEEHQNKQQVDGATSTEEAQVYLCCQYKSELFPAWWAVMLGYGLSQ